MRWLILITTAWWLMLATTAQAGEVRYMLWDASQRPLYQQCANQFEKSHPGVRIRIQQQGWDDYWTTLSTGLVAETAPDVFTNHLSKYPDLVANGQLVDLSPFITRDGLDAAGYRPGLPALWQSGGHQWGLPKDWDTVALMVNLDHAKQAGVGLAELQTMAWNPQDGDSFGRIAARLSRDAAGRNALDPAFDKAHVQVYGFQNPGAGGMMGQTEWGHFAASTGFKLQDQPWSTALHYDDPRLAATLQWLASLPARGVSAAPQAMGKLGSDAMFTTGRVAMVPSGSWMIGHFARQARFATAWVPLPRGPSGQRSSMLNGLADSIWIGSKNKAEAWAWVRHMGSPACQGLLADAGVVFPALQGLHTRALAAHQRAGVDSQVFVDAALNGSYAPPVIANAAEITDIVGSAIEAVLLGRVDAAASMRQAQARVQAVLKR